MSGLNKLMGRGIISPWPTGCSTTVQRFLHCGPLVLDFDNSAAKWIVVPEARVVGRLDEQPAKLAREAAQQGPLVAREPQADLALRGALDPPSLEHQSCRIVAQSPCAWRRATSCSAFSRVPLETTALPSLCTWSMSLVAFARS